MAKPNEVKLAADIIRRVLDAAERGDIEFLSYLRTASRRRPHDSRSAPTSKQENLDIGSSNIRELSQKSILDDFSRFDSESRLGQHIKNKYPTKSDLSNLARILHIPTPKTDDYESLSERVIASTIGYKMRSEAVRGSQSLPKRSESDDEA